MIEILPSPGTLEQDQSAIEHKLSLVKPFTRTVHIDLIDGKFAPNTTFQDPSFFSRFKGEFEFELHMMVDDPLQYVQPWYEAGITRFVGHVEKMPSQSEFVSRVSDVAEVGLAFDLETSLDKLAVPIYDLDSVLIMTVKAGFSGQQFQEEALKKVELLRSQASIVIEVDGGINDQTITKALQAGADRFVVTSYLFGSEQPHERYAHLQHLCQSRVGV